MKIETFGPGQPAVTFVVGVHGDEQAPVRGVEILKELVAPHDMRGSFRVITANEEALAMGARCIEKDLNRSFPGERSGSIEEKLAVELTEILKDTEYLFDFHTTTFPVPPYAVFSIYSSRIGEILSHAGVSAAVFDKSESLIKYARNAAAIECGQESDERTPAAAAHLMRQILCSCGVLEGGTEKNAENLDLRLLLIYDVLEKARLETLDPLLADFEPVKRGQRIGTAASGEEITAGENFYPVWINHPSRIRKAKRIFIEE